MPEITQSPQIRSISAKTLAGMSMEHCLAERKISLLWRRFMPRRGEITNTRSPDLYALHVYEGVFDPAAFTSETRFVSWATLETGSDGQVPEGMETFTLRAGTYAVFIHKGSVDSFPETFDLIFRQWLPDSDYELDDRPHFEVLGEHYLGPENPESMEEVWVPVRKKQDIKPMPFPTDFYRFLKHNSLVFVKGGSSDHDFLDIWMVVVDKRVFARSWNRSRRSWFTAFQDTGKGKIKFGDKIMDVKGEQLPSGSPVHSLIDKAYLDRFTDPDIRMYAEGIARKEYHPYTMEFFFQKTLE